MNKEPKKIKDEEEEDDAILIDDEDEGEKDSKKESKKEEKKDDSTEDDESSSDLENIPDDDDEEDEPKKEDSTSSKSEEKKDDDDDDVEEESDDEEDEDDESTTLEDIPEEEEDDEESKSSEDEDDDESVEEGEELPDENGETSYDGQYKIGYYKITPSDKETTPDSSMVTKIVESIDHVDDEFASSFLSSLEEDEEDFEHFDDMVNDEDFSKAIDINNTLDSTLLAFDGTINPYGAIIAITDVLYRYGFIVPDFSLDPSVDEWIYDVQLMDENSKEIPWYLHLEILKNNDDSFFVCAGIVPA